MTSESKSAWQLATQPNVGPKATGTTKFRRSCSNVSCEAVVVVVARAVDAEKPRKFYRTQLNSSMERHVCSPPEGLLTSTTWNYEARNHLCSQTARETGLSVAYVCTVASFPLWSWLDRCQNSRDSSLFNLLARLSRLFFFFLLSVFSSKRYRRLMNLGICTRSLNWAEEFYFIGSSLLLFHRNVKNKKEK